VNGFLLKAGEYFGSVEFDDFHGGVDKTTFFGDSTDELDEPPTLSLFSGMTRPFSFERALRRRCSRSVGARSADAEFAACVDVGVGLSWTELRVRPLGLGGSFL